MNPDRILHISRRRFLASTSLAAAAVSFTSPRLVAEEESPVTVIRGASATAKITVQKLRGNISVLIGSGGNIGVLTGRDGKLLVDAGHHGIAAWTDRSARQPRAGTSEASRSTRTGIPITPTATSGCTRRAPKSPPTRTPANTSP